MSTNEEHLDRIREIVARDSRYRIEAYLFTLEGLTFTQELERAQGRQGHIDGRRLLEGIRDLARKNFGYLARAVFREWGVRSTLDFGEIVFNLVEVQLLAKQETDQKSDFADAYDFSEAFETAFIH